MGYLSSPEFSPKLAKIGCPTSSFFGGYKILISHSFGFSGAVPFLSKSSTHLCTSGWVFFFMVYLPNRRLPGVYHPTSAGLHRRNKEHVKIGISKYQKAKKAEARCGVKIVPLKHPPLAGKCGEFLRRLEVAGGGPVI